MRASGPYPHLVRNILVSIVALLGFVAGLPAAAATGDVPLEFDRIDLNDGRVLKKVVVKSYDAASEKLLVVADGKAMTIPIALIPPPFDRHLRKAPASGSSVSTIGARTMSTAAKQYTVATSVPAAGQPVLVVPGLQPQAVRPPTPPPAEEPAPAVRAQQTAPVVRREPSRAPVRQPPSPPDTGAGTAAEIARHAAAAQQRARTYFRYEFQIGSGSISVTSLDFQWSRPKPVPGWPGRYETEGKAFLEFYDSKGGSFQRTTRAFEIVTEQKPDGDLDANLRMKS